MNEENETKTNKQKKRSSNNNNNNTSRNSSGNEKTSKLKENDIIVWLTERDSTHRHSAGALMQIQQIKRISVMNGRADALLYTFVNVLSFSVVWWFFLSVSII